MNLLRSRSQCSRVPLSRWNCYKQLQFVTVATKLRRRKALIHTVFLFLHLHHKKKHLTSPCLMHLFPSYIHTSPLSNNLAISSSCTESLGPESLAAEAPRGGKAYMMWEYTDTTSYLLKARKTTCVQKWSNSSMARSKTMEFTPSDSFTFLK